MGDTKTNLKKSLVTVVIFVAIIGVFSTTWAYVDNQNKIKAEAMEIEAERIRLENEEKKYNVGVNNEGKQYSYDASIVADKLNQHDYSNNGNKVVFLTFDDGASLTNTPKILDILKEENVKATFFLTGQTIKGGGDEAINIVKREFNEGHAIANHSYSHDLRKLYPGRVLDIDAFKEDFEQNEIFLKEILG